MVNRMNRYDHDEVYEKTLDYFSGDDMATAVWMSKYALRNDDGTYAELTPRDMHRRLAREFARIEGRYDSPMSEDEIFDMFDGFKYVVPQGSPMAGIGDHSTYQSISNCFVIDSPYDSYAGIMLTDQEQVQIMKRRGGVGFDISTLRPKGVDTSNAAKTSDGIGVFMERFSNSCREVAQGGRRGALLLSISCMHPDVETFTSIKDEKAKCGNCGHEYRHKVTGANVSIRMTDEFMEAVDRCDDVTLRWPVDSDDPVYTCTVSARDLWSLIVKHAHAAAEPGMLFWDTVTRRTPADVYDGYETVSTNPCGELPLSPYDSCRLMVVNVLSFVVDPYTDRARFDFDAFDDVVMKAQRLMDDMVDLEIEKVEGIIEKIQRDPEPDVVKAVELELWRKILRNAQTGRRTGLGPTAIGDAIAAMGYKYDSDEAIKFVEDVYKALTLASYKSSIEMARDRGHFAIYDRDRERGHEYLDQIYDALPDVYRKMWDEYGRRNIANTTTAPCGSVSILTQTTSGIEPVIFLKYRRRRKVNRDDTTVSVDFIDELGDAWQEYDMIHPGLIKWMRVNGWSDDDIAKWLNDEVDLMKYDDCPYVGSTAFDIDPMRKLMIQAAAQKWVCHAISNTINMPTETTVEQVAELYMTAWHLGCKGVTIYRDGCRSGVLVKDEVDDVVFVDHHAPKRPESLPCEVHRTSIRGEKWMVFVGLLNDRPYEIFGGLSENIELPKRITSGRLVKRAFKQGGKYDLYFGDDDDPIKIRDIVKQFDNPNYSLATRLLSTMLRHGTPIQYVVEQLQKDREADMFSFAKVIARVLKKYIPDGSQSTTVCKSCDARNTIHYQGGCEICTNCGASSCG